MAAKRTRAKGIVHLRERKLTDGSKSLYLDIYSHNKRYTKSLNLKIYPVRTPIDKEHNAKTQQLAETLRAEKQIELQHTQHGIQDDDQLDRSFLNYFWELTEKRKASQGNYGNWDSVHKHLQKYAGQDVSFGDLDKFFVLGFKEYLMEDAVTKSEVPLSPNSQSSYFNKLKTAIKQAQADGIIKTNPAFGVKGIKAETPEREYLTMEELRKIAKADCKYPILKEAFLFSCITGLRWSDIQKLTWSEIHDNNEGSRIVFRQKKTKGMEYLPMSKQAREMIGERRDGEERVFQGLKYSTYHNLELLRWAMRAGIMKHITFHSGRHTYATLQLTMGTDIYTVSKLLGHSEIRTTQIYGKIIDQKKEEAVERIPPINL